MKAEENINKQKYPCQTFLSKGIKSFFFCSNLQENKKRNENGRMWIFVLKHGISKKKKIRDRRESESLKRCNEMSSHFFFLSAAFLVTVSREELAGTRGEN
jgi:hypothetical protein